MFEAMNDKALAAAIADVKTDVETLDARISRMLDERYAKFDRLNSLESERLDRKGQIQKGDVFITNQPQSSFVRITVIGDSDDETGKWLCKSVKRNGSEVITQIYADTLRHCGRYKKEEK